MNNLSREQVISARDRARTKLARQRSAMQATEAELSLWDKTLQELDKQPTDQLNMLDSSTKKR